MRFFERGVGEEKEEKKWKSWVLKFYIIFLSVDASPGIDGWSYHVFIRYQNEICPMRRTRI